MDSIISITGLSKSFGLRKALDGIDLEIHKGEFVAIFGPNGAGKTTLLKIISTVSEPTRGSVVINGLDSKTDPNVIRGMIGAISHETYLYDELTAKENLLFFSRIYGVEKSAMQEQVDKLLKSVKLFNRADERVGSFSRGMKQRLSIARALLHSPVLLLMDEPYTGLDQQAAENFERVLMNTGSSEVTRIMITHNIERAFELCDRMLIMDRGKILFDKMKKDICSAPEFRQEYLSIVEKDIDEEGISNY
ncbi:MAG: ABC transporter ATP-binding protein [Methanolobus sp.]|nr:ABC transporter ATP-binding protein [Methanolobus sp.]